VSATRLARRHREIAKEGLRLSRRKGEGSAGIEVGSKAAQERQSEPRHHRLGGLTIARVSTAAMGHVGHDGPGQSFHADFYGLLTPTPVQVLMNVARKRRATEPQGARSWRLDVAGNHPTEPEMLTGVMEHDVDVIGDGQSRC